MLFIAQKRRNTGFACHRSRSQAQNIPYQSELFRDSIAVNLYHYYYYSSGTFGGTNDYSSSRTCIAIVYR